MSGLQLPEGTAAGSGPATKSLAVSQTTTYGWSLAEDLDGFARAGIGGIGLYRPKLEEADEETAVEAIRDSGLSVSSLSWVGGFTGSDGARQVESLYDAFEAIRFAAQVAAGTVCVVSGGAGHHIATHARRLLLDALRQLSDEAAELGVRLALHPLADAASRHQSFVTTTRHAADLVSAVDRPNVGVVLDLFSLSVEPDTADEIFELAPLVHVVKLSDRRHRPGRADRRRQIGDGSLPIASVVRSLVAAGYAGPFEIDLGPTDGRDDYDRLLMTCRQRFEGLAAAAGVTA